MMPLCILHNAHIVTISRRAGEMSILPLFIAAQTNKDGKITLVEADGIRRLLPEELWTLVWPFGSPLSFANRTELKS